MSDRFRTFLRWLAPHGFGTRAFLAFAIVGGWLAYGKFDSEALNAVVMLVLTYYFKDRGASHPSEPPKETGR